MSVPDSQHQNYAQLRKKIRNGDWLLWYPTTLAGELICLVSGERHSHASMAAWGYHDRLYSVEMLQWYGGRHQPLSEQIAKYPGRCEVWRPLGTSRKPYNGYGAAFQMLLLMGAHYGWMDFWRIGVRKLFPNIVGSTLVPG